MWGKMKNTSIATLNDTCRSVRCNLEEDIGTRMRRSAVHVACWLNLPHNCAMRHYDTTEVFKRQLSFNDCTKAKQESLPCTQQDIKNKFSLKMPMHRVDLAHLTLNFFRFSNACLL